MAPKLKITPMNRVFTKKVMLATAIFITAVFFITACKSKVKQEAKPPALKVLQIKGKNIPVYLEMVGQAVGIPTVEIRARVSGYLQTWSFQEGSVVQKGQPLFTIEKDSYINTLKFNEADLQNKQAAWEKAKLDVARLKPLLTTNAISQNDYDKAVTTELQDRAAVASAQANLDQARLNLSYCTMTSPITGYIGACQVQPGNLVGKSESTLLTTVSAVDPIYVNFQMNETDYLRIMEYVESHKEEFKDKKDALKIFVTLSDKSLYKYPGKIDFMDREINPQTGTLAIRAELPNPEGLIKPGTFTQVFMVLKEQEDGVLIPQGATTQIQGKNFAFLVDKDNKVNRVSVDLGRNIGSFVVVNAGLKSSDKILLEGFQKFQEGMVIEPLIVQDTFSVSQTPGK
jgi:membrane fusion protein (multidrug efflux system)